VPENHTFMDKIATNLCGSYLTSWVRQFSQTYTAELVGPDGTVSMAQSYMISLRTSSPVRYERVPGPEEPAEELPAAKATPADRGSSESGGEVAS
jgi:hypothetical protein